MKSGASGVELGPAMSDAAAKWKPFWLASYFVGLAASTLMAIRSDERPHGTPFIIVLATAVFAAGWHYAMAVRRTAAHRQTRPMLLWAIVAVGVTAALVWMAPVCLFAASFLFAQIFQLMPARSASYVAISYCALLFYPIEISLGRPFAMSICFAGLGASLFSRFVSSVIEQSRARRETIRDLREAESLVADIERNRGRIEERSRIARELHDTVTQDLIGITMQLEAVEDALPSESREVVTRVRDLSRGALSDARGIVHATRPRQLQHGSLRDALSALSTSRSDGPRVDVVADADADADDADAADASAALALDAEQEAVLLRVAQEALSNARRHARASVVTITLSRGGDACVMLDVHDDGCGFDTSTAKAGFGLESMRDRVQSAHGSLEIESARDSGTVVHVEIPTHPSVATRRRHQAHAVDTKTKTKTKAS